jgi:pimeloyl-ACP methyl ester carboxylesterase
MNSSYLYLNGLRFHYLRQEADGAGRPLVLHHGLASNARIWELTAPRLASRGHPVFALDARGHGLSDKPDDGYDIQTITGDLTAFIQACGLEKPVLVGHSWGGSIALNYATRFAAGPFSPAGIVLVDGGISQLDDAGATWEEMEQRLTPPRLAGMPLSEFQPRLEAWFAEWGGSEQAVSITLGNFEIGDDECIYPRLAFERHMRIVRAIWDFKTYDYFARVRCPTLMIPARPKEPHSPPDRAYLHAKERGVARAQASIFDLRVAWMEDTIHDIPLQRPDELADLITVFAASLDQA